MCLRERAGLSVIVLGHMWLRDEGQPWFWPVMKEGLALMAPSVFVRGNASLHQRQSSWSPTLDCKQLMFLLDSQFPDIMNTLIHAPPP